MLTLKSAILAAALLTSGCAVREANLRVFEDQRPTTPTERAAITAHIKSTFLDPYSIRDPEISYAAPSMTITGETTLNVCVSANAKNSFGAYVGKQATLYYLTPSGRILNTNRDMFAENFCANRRLRYEPFAEIARSAQ